MIYINYMSSFFSCLSLHFPKKVSFLFFQFPSSQFKMRVSRLVQETDGWALTQEVGDAKSVSLLRRSGISKTVIYHRNEQTLHAFLCLEFGGKTNLRELWSDSLAVFARIRMFYTVCITELLCYTPEMNTTL